VENVAGLAPFRAASPERPAGGRLDAFRAADAFAMAAVKAAADLQRSPCPELAAEIRRLVLRGGGALVAASCAPPGGDDERALVGAARDRLAEARYALYLARRLGALDLRRYRVLAAQQDAALREVAALLEPTAGPRRPP
jgi:hypothetical protein